MHDHQCKGQQPKAIKRGKGKSKSLSAVAEMAKANQSGNGVLFEQEKEK